MTGVLASYLLFLALHLKHPWLSTLPVAFAETEALVKQGFWQLIILTAFNIGLFFHVNRRSTDTIQAILSVFTVASLLLLGSAGHRLFLYMTSYGFSYEKLAWAPWSP